MNSLKLFVFLFSLKEKLSLIYHHFEFPCQYFTSIKNLIASISIRRFNFYISVSPFCWSFFFSTTSAKALLQIIGSANSIFILILFNDKEMKTISFLSQEC